MRDLFKVFLAKQTVLLFLAGSLLVNQTTRSVAEDLRHSLSFSVGYDRTAQLIDQGGTLSYDFVRAPYFSADYQAVRALDNGARLTFSTDINVSGTPQSEGPDLDFGMSLAYQYALNDSNSLKFRITGFVDRSVSNDGWTFQRERLAFRLQQRHSPERSTAIQLRFGYRDQNESTFPGFDQQEFLGELTHTWRPNRDRLALSGIAYFDSRRAELDQYSYDEFGIRLMLRVPVGDETEITARASYYQRDFLDGFSAANPTVREDERIRGSLEIERTLRDNLSLEFSVGWDENLSTISERRYSGLALGLGVNFELN